MGMERLREPTMTTLDDLQVHGDRRIMYGGMTAIIRVLIDGENQRQQRMSRETIGKRLGWNGPEHVESLSLVLNLGITLGFFGVTNSHYFVTDELLAELKQLKEQANGGDALKMLSDRWAESPLDQPGDWFDHPPAPATLGLAIRRFFEIPTEHDGTQPLHVAAQSAEELENLRQRQAAELMAKWRGIKSDPSRIGKEVRSGKITMTADGRLTKRAVALRVIEMKKPRPTRKSGEGNACPDCGQPSHKFIGAVYYKCFDRNIIRAE